VKARRFDPYLVLAVMLVLCLGGAILGLELAPPHDDLAVNNAAGLTLLAPSFTTHATETVIGPGGAHQTQTAVATVVPPPPTASVSKIGASGAVVSLLRMIEKSPNWKSMPSGTYVYTGSATEFLHQPVPAGATLQVQVQTQNGYVSAFRINLLAKSGIGQTLRFVMTRIGDFHPTAPSISV
jgi:hypothetical protein